MSASSQTTFAPVRGCTRVHSGGRREKTLLLLLLVFVMTRLESVRLTDIGVSLEVVQCLQEYNTDLSIMKRIGNGLCVL